MIILTAKRWGYDNPIIKYSKRIRVCRAAATQMAYGNGYCKILSYNQVSIWISKVNILIDKIMTKMVIFCRVCIMVQLLTFRKLRWQTHAIFINFTYMLARQLVRSLVFHILLSVQMGRVQFRVRISVIYLYQDINWWTGFLAIMARNTHQKKNH